MRSLVIGRFQPLHCGHLKMIEYVAEMSNFITIGVGSCNSRNSVDNPFTAEEREEMLKESLRIKPPYEIRRIPDFGDNRLWISWVRENIRFDTFYTNSPIERKIFQDAGLAVEVAPFFDRDKYSATEVRRRILEDEDWMSLLPEGTIAVLSTIDGIFRIKKLSIK